MQLPEVVLRGSSAVICTRVLGPNPTCISNGSLVADMSVGNLRFPVVSNGSLWLPSHWAGTDIVGSFQASCSLPCQSRQALTVVIQQDKPLAIHAYNNPWVNATRGCTMGGCI